MIRPSRATCLFARFARDTRGAVSIMAALMMVLGLGLAALVMDSGRLYLDKRRLQAAVDAAALAAVADTTQASSLAARSLVLNGYDGTATVTTGVYSTDPSVAESTRFTAGTTSPNAVRVTKTVSSTAFLAAIFNGGGGSNVQATATAAQIPAVAFSAGTGLGTLTNGQINQVLGGLFQTTNPLTVTLANYNALAAANADALTFLNQLATQVNVTAGTYGDLANTSVTVGQVIAAARATLNIQGGNNNAALDALSVLSVQLPQSASVTLGQVINDVLWQKRTIGSVVQQKMGQTNINLFDVVSAMARVYGAGHLATLSTAITLPITGTGTTTWLAVGSPVASVGLSPVGTSIGTSQIRMYFYTTLLNTTLGGYPITVGLPVYLQIASGTATAAAICTSSGRATINAAAQGGVAKIGTVTQADFNNFSADPPVADTNGVSATVLGITVAFKTTGGITIAGTNPAQPLYFQQSDIDTGRPQTIAGSDSGHVFTRLANSMNVTANFSGAGPVLTTSINNILNTTLTGLVKGLVVSLVTALDPVTDTLLRTLGLRLGEMDVLVHGVSCGTPTLVH